MIDTKFQRNTRQRKMILEELQKVEGHPTAVELHAAVRRRLPRISLGTVYRNLDLLATMGKIQKLDLGGGEARFDGNPQGHYHVRCTTCGRIEDVDGVPAGLLRSGPADAAGYKILGHRLEFLGICPQCKGRPESDRADPTRS